MIPSLPAYLLSTAGVLALAGLFITFWLFRIWRATRDAAYIWLIAAWCLPSVLPLLVEVLFIRSIYDFAHASGLPNLAWPFERSFKRIVGGYFYFTLLFMSFVNIEGGRVGGRELFRYSRQDADEAAGFELATHGKRRSIWAVWGLFVLLCIVQAVVCAVAASQGPPYPALRGSWWIVTLLQLLAGWWLFRLWQVSGDGAYTWLIAALAGVPLLQTLSHFVLPMPTAIAGSGNLEAVVEHFRSLIFLCMTAACMVMALRQMAGGVVGVRDLFKFPVSRRDSAEDD